jgi:hypothetical protein
VIWNYKVSPWKVWGRAVATVRTAHSANAITYKNENMGKMGNIKLILTTHPKVFRTLFILVVFRGWGCFLFSKALGVCRPIRRGRFGFIPNVRWKMVLYLALWFYPPATCVCVYKHIAGSSRFLLVWKVARNTWAGGIPLCEIDVVQ